MDEYYIIDVAAVVLVADVVVTAVVLVADVVIVTAVVFVADVAVDHRHLRDIDCSLAVVGRPAAESGGKSIHWPYIWCQKVLLSSCCGWQHNFCSQQRQAG